MKTIEEIKKQINNNLILIYMKGTPKNPNCSFSEKAVQILFKCCNKFSYVNILEKPFIKQELPKYSNWYTFPQIWINKEFIGGYDIIKYLYKTKELQKMIKNIQK
ncbi:Grx4 family monothiol glutaredoxin [Enterobacteriaceae bacterium ET-AT1-13]|nr:Grx4 family monothiol glutaredoxin [Enterobacteriaceae bacterium ET-AT1-13]WGS66383.1 Grx4 family monothiol glutaredoxin [Enterobacteriaceae bacterium Cmel17]WMC17409.1 MAG: Grx4 family monothiol glutaredoxin [Enterobacteriaceae bacterium Cmel21]WMC17615.1 MAG: Grx4 family monothiol glutaredoxin [Enterobacteriaceae bacterium PSmelAO3-2]WMC17820.1 MAG: Grx4 family monothiol glutaredoxin [Enterobacteriaceae bacterium PSmelAO3-1]WMC18023.1 MAG: Grx4 family monothiol glutaredoxin [Enterobacteri